MPVTHNDSSRQAVKHSVADAIKKLRVALGVSQEKLARRLGLTNVTVNKYEQGYSLPVNSVLRDLALIAIEIDMEDQCNVFLTPISEQIKTPVHLLRKVMFTAGVAA